MLTLSKPERLRTVKLQHSLPQLPKAVGHEIPNYKKLFQIKKPSLDYQFKSNKSPTTSFSKTKGERLSLLDHLE